MTRIHISLRIPATAPMPELITLIQDAEAAGFDGVGIIDSQLTSRDTFVTLGLAAVNTSAPDAVSGRDQSHHSARVGTGQRRAIR